MDFHPNHLEILLKFHFPHSVFSEYCPKLFLPMSAALEYFLQSIPLEKLLLNYLCYHLPVSYRTVGKSEPHYLILLRNMGKNFSFASLFPLHNYIFIFNIIDRLHLNYIFLSSYRQLTLICISFLYIPI